MTTEASRISVLESQIEDVRREIGLLRETMTDKFSAQTHATEVAMAAAKEATTKAEAAHEKRFEGVNEFRATLADQQRTFVTRSEMDLRAVGVDKQIDDMQRWRQAVDDKLSAQAGRGAGTSAAWGYLIAFIGVVATIIGTVMLFFVTNK